MGAVNSSAEPEEHREEVASKEVQHWVRICLRKSVLLTAAQAGNLKLNLQCTRELLEGA